MHQPRVLQAGFRYNGPCNPLRASTKRRLPVVLTVNEVQALFDNLNETHGLMARLIYGCGLRVSECVRLRVKDLDLERNVNTFKGI